MRPEIDSNRHPALPKAHDMLGLACLIACLLLMSFGVNASRAEDEPLMSVDPARVEAERQRAAAKLLPQVLPAQPSVPAEQHVERARRNARAAGETPGAGLPAAEVQPGVIVLNTRGFNYGPPPAGIDPAAMRAEEGPEATN
ncbi:MAG: hypothetical protein AB8G23_13780 [Myxococcota bacterium]